MSHCNSKPWATLQFEVRRLLYTEFCYAYTKPSIPKPEKRGLRDSKVSFRKQLRVGKQDMAIWLFRWVQPVVWNLHQIKAKM